MQELLLNYFSFTKINIVFACTGALLTILTVFSAWNYIIRKRGLYFYLNIGYLVSLLIVILTDNWFIFLIAWELVTVTTTLLLLWSNQRIARQYFIIQFFGSSILLYAILLALSNGYAQIGPVQEVWLQNLLIAGVAMKSAIFPFHFWLPPIHATAPSPVSAVLSGWVVKLGFIACLKIIPEGNLLLLILGFVMIFYGGIKALLASDYKVLLANSTVSQLGFIALGIGSGTLYGYIGSIFHIIAHGLAKTTLFIGSAYLIKEYESRSIYRFQGVLQRQKLNTISMLIAFLSLMGLPLLAGYNSKHLIKYGLKGELVFTILLHAASLVTILYGLRFLRWGIFSEMISRTKKGIKGKRMGITERLSLFPGILLLLILGVFPVRFLFLLSQDGFVFHPLTGLRDFMIYLFIGIILLSKFKWLKTPEKEPPSLDRLFRRIYDLLYAFSVKSREFDTDVLFESFMYRKIFALSRALFNFVFTSYQVQLFWIPVFLLILLFWISR